MLHSVPRIVALVSACTIVRVCACWYSSKSEHKPKPLYLRSCHNFFCLNFYMRRIEFTSEMCKKLMESIFLTMKATFLVIFMVDTMKLK